MDSLRPRPILDLYCPLTKVKETNITLRKISYRGFLLNRLGWPCIHFVFGTFFPAIENRVDPSVDGSNLGQSTSAIHFHLKQRSKTKFNFHANLIIDPVRVSHSKFNRLSKFFGKWKELDWILESNSDMFPYVALPKRSRKRSHLELLSNFLLIKLTMVWS